MKLDDAIDLIVVTMRRVAEDVERGMELPGTPGIPATQILGYARACRDMAITIERRSIAGGVLQRVDEL